MRCRLQFSRLLRFLAASLLSTIPALAQPATNGTIAGQVFDAQTARPINGARIAVNGVTAGGMATDTDGRFNFSMAPGKYTLRFTADNYASVDVTDVEVKVGEVVDASTVMANKALVTSVDVVEKVGAIASSAEATMTERKLAAVVSDSIGGDEIRKTVASDAAGALEKVTGVSIVDSGYVYVRGLGERYSSTMLNNAMIPTTEPEKRVVPLDMFPANLIDNIRVLKTYSPDLPGEFSGGVVQMSTIEFPTTRTMRVSLSQGFNTNTSFGNFNSYPGGVRDAFGFDNGVRSLPSSIPSQGRLFAGRYSAAELQQFGRSFTNNWQTQSNQSQRPQGSYSLSGGDSFFNGRVGIVGAISFTNQPQRTDALQRYFINVNDQPVAATEYPTMLTDLEGIRLGAVLNVALKLSNSNKVVFRNTVTRDTDKEARFMKGFNSNLETNIEATRLRWIERGLLSTGVEGEHVATKLGNLLLKWQFTYSSSVRDEPDLRETVYGLNSNGTRTLIASTESGIRFFSGLNDRIYEPLAEASLPFFKGGLSGILKFGFRGTLRDRDFAARRFRFLPIDQRTLNFTQSPNQLFAPGNIRPDGFQIREFTRGTDSYDATMDIYGGFAMVDLALSPKLRLITGARIEDADINVSTIDPLVPGAVPVKARLKNRDALPGANVIYSLTARQNLRVGYGRTVNRPDFRELSPFDFTNVVGGFATQGNPNLLRAKIDNVDVRWEWFPSGDQVIAASYFYKRFDNPIEVAITPTGSVTRQSFLNADNAINQGFELEFRRNLGNMFKKRAAVLAPFSLQSNFTFVDSSVKLPTGTFLSEILTSKSRPLVGQSRFIFNTILDWNNPRWRSNARFFVNSVSRRITDVGTFRLPDIYQERNLFLDFSYQYDLRESGRWSLRFTAENLTDNKYHWTQGPETFRQFQIGRTFTVGTSFSIF